MAINQIARLSITNKPAIMIAIGLLQRQNGTNRQVVR